MHGIEVLDLVNLYPRVSVYVGIGCCQRVVGEQQQVFKIQQLVLSAVRCIGMGKPHLGEQPLDGGLDAHVVVCRACGVPVEVHVLVHVGHLFGSKLLVLYLADIFHGRNVLRGQTFGMQPQVPGMPVGNLVHEMGEVDHLRIALSAVKTLLDPVFVFLQIAGKDAEGIVIIDNGRS